jgi:hypothetical protein
MRPADAISTLITTASETLSTQLLLELDPEAATYARGRKRRDRQSERNHDHGYLGHIFAGRAAIDGEWRQSE